MFRAVLLMLLATASTALKAEWLEVGSNETTATYADPATISRSDDRVKMWHLIGHATARGIEGLRPYRSIKVHGEYDCKQERMRTLAISLHSGNMGEGEVVGASRETGDWRPVRPDTVVDTLRRFACWK